MLLFIRSFIWQNIVWCDHFWGQRRREVVGCPCWAGEGREQGNTHRRYMLSEVSRPLCLELGATTIMAVHLLSPESHPIASCLSWPVPPLATQRHFHLHVCLLACHFTLGGFWPLPGVPFPPKEASSSNSWGGTEETMNECDPEGLSTRTTWGNRSHSVCAEAEWSL